MTSTFIVYCPTFHSLPNALCHLTARPLQNKQLRCSLRMQLTQTKLAHVWRLSCSGSGGTWQQLTAWALAPHSNERIQSQELWLHMKKCNLLQNWSWNIVCSGKRYPCTNFWWIFWIFNHRIDLSANFFWPLRLWSFAHPAAWRFCPDFVLPCHSKLHRISNQPILDQWQNNDIWYYMMICTCILVLWLFLAKFLFKNNLRNCDESILTLGLPNSGVSLF